MLIGLIVGSIYFAYKFANEGLKNIEEGNRLMAHYGNPTTRPPLPRPQSPLGAHNALGGYDGGSGDGLAVTRKCEPLNARRRHPDNRAIPGVVFNPDKPPAKPNRTAQRFSRPLPDDWVMKSDHRYWDLDRPEPRELEYEMK